MLDMHAPLSLSLRQWFSIGVVTDLLGGVCRWMGGWSALHVRAPVCCQVLAGVPLRASILCMPPVQAVAGSER
jgi:hypothetical protein